MGSSLSTVSVYGPLWALLIHHGCTWGHMGPSLNTMGIHGVVWPLLLYYGCTWGPMGPSPLHTVVFMWSYRPLLLILCRCPMGLSSLYTLGVHGVLRDPPYILWVYMGSYKSFLLVHYGCTWSPQITISIDTWEKIEDKKLSIQQMFEEI